jgi:hypothetical protein
MKQPVQNGGSARHGYVHRRLRTATDDAREAIAELRI